MRRDMDFVRELILRIENGQSAFDIVSKEDPIFSLNIAPTQVELFPTREEAERVEYHLNFLEECSLGITTGRLPHREGAIAGPSNRWPPSWHTVYRLHPLGGSECPLRAAAKVAEHR